MSFGKRLQILRRSKGITQEAFAQQLNVSRQAVSKWESSKGYPEMEKILYICSHYGVAYVPEEENLFRVQVGAFRIRENAEKLLEKLKASGYDDVFITGGGK